MTDTHKGLPVWCGLTAALLMMVAPAAYAADDDKDAPPAAESTGAPGNAKTEEPDGADKGDENVDDAGKDQAGGPGENNERKGSIRLKDLVADGYLIRTTVFIPADAVTRQTGSVSADAMVLTLQKETAIAVCYYTFKAYVKGGKGLMKIPSCTVYD